MSELLTLTLEMRVEEIAKLISNISDTFYSIGFKILAAKTCENDFLNKLI